jgi:hypothetical protein
MTGSRNRAGAAAPVELAGDVHLRHGLYELRQRRAGIVVLLKNIILTI